MNSRNRILESIRKGTGRPSTPGRYILPAWTNDPAAAFVDRAKSSIARVTEIESPDDAPSVIWAILRETNAAPRLHVPAASAVRELPWHRAPGLTIAAAPPTGEDAAFAIAEYGIAETGTLVFLSGARSPSSWHFRPGLEIVLLRRNQILPRFEDVLEIMAGKPMPATMNLITGPSRTADVEQTIELGAHGPRDVHILLSG